MGPREDGDARQDALRALPGVDRVIEAIGAGAAPASVVAGAARRAVDAARERIRTDGGAPSFDDIVAEARDLIAARDRSLLRPVVNATGVLIHTNLGRAPLGERQLDAVTAVARGYSNLEYDLTGGTRGSRYDHARSLLTTLTGAEAALVVNNNAAAVLITLAALCAGRDVVISRGELIEIGGEFRIPEIMAASGARLVEVGTTNRTHVSDYEKAIGPDTAAILKVHPSNYRVVGFTASVAARDLARLARGRKVAFVHDLGSGLVAAPDDAAWADVEPPVDVAVSEGADVVTFSGDKLLGGPQAGVIAGRGEFIERIGKHPLLRALRVDKMTLAALEATLVAYLGGRGGELPLWELAAVPLDALETRARRLADSFASADFGAKVEAVATRSVTGGGSLPGTELSSWGLAVTHSSKSAAEVARALRFGDPPVVARVEDDRVVLDLRTVFAHEDDALRDALHAALS